MSNHIGSPTFGSVSGWQRSKGSRTAASEVNAWMETEAKQPTHRSKWIKYDQII